jgi:hypothetical protein
MPAPQAVAFLPQGEQLVQMWGPSEVSTLNQIIIVLKNGQRKYKPLHPDITAKALHKMVACEDWHRVIIWSDESCGRYASLLESAFPGDKREDPGSMGPGLHPASVRVRCLVSGMYFRAIAKIAFHHFLVHTCRDVLGTEPEFEPIRQFLICGGDRHRFFRQERHFTVDLPRGRSHSHYSHYLSFDERQGQVYAYVWLFANSNLLNRGHNLVLGRIPSSLEVPSALRAHEYRCASKGTAGLRGKVLKVSVVRVKGMNELGLVPGP